ncbi:MAG TPA: hypothetical protein VMC08_09700 [Bacteroidales bacterium]|nr:hypothetical protein [Bacteroidales bacterium]
MRRWFTGLIPVVLLLSGSVQAQNGAGPNDVISKSNVTIDLLKSIFENSYLEIKETGNDFFEMKDVYSIYVDLDNDSRYFTLSVNWPINDASQADKLNLLNKIGKDVLLVTPYYSETGSSLIVKTTVWIEGGTLVKNIVMTEKLFVKALNLILEKDTQKIIQ